MNQYGNQFLYSFVPKLTWIECNFIVDSANSNGLGIRSLKGRGVSNVYMNTSSGAPSGTPAFGSARQYGILAASAITNTGSSTVAGNIGITPGSAITGFPPGTFTGSEDVDNARAVAAKAAAQAAYTDLQARSATTIATALDGQSLSAGVYHAASGTFTLAQSGAGTLTLTGSATDVFVFRMDTTLTTGAGGIPTITLSGGALASNVYWAVGSSATINSGSAGVFQGNIIAQASITDTLGGTVNGSLVALTGAVTLSAASTIVTQSVASQPASGNPNPAPGNILVQFQSNYNRYLAGHSGFVAPLVGSAISISGSNVLTAHQAYVIVSVGTSTSADWVAAGVPANIPPAPGVPFIAAGAGSFGAGSGQVKAVGASGVDHIEVVGDPNLTINQLGQPYMLLECLASSVLTAPADNTVVSLAFWFRDSSANMGSGE